MCGGVHRTYRRLGNSNLRIDSDHMGDCAARTAALFISDKEPTGASDRKAPALCGNACDMFVPYLSTVLIYLAFANLIGLFGVKPPTKDLNVTAALALMSIVLVQYASIHSKGAGGWLKSFKEPMAIVTPINILELFIKPLSLCMRLFGNVLGAFVIMELIKILAPAVAPVPFSLYFDIFDGLIQAYVFVFLTSLYIREAVE